MRLIMSRVRFSAASSLEIWAVMLLTPSPMSTVFECLVGRLELKSDIILLSTQMDLDKGWKATCEDPGSRLSGAAIFGI